MHEGGGGGGEGEGAVWSVCACVWVPRRDVGYVQHGVCDLIPQHKTSRNGFLSTGLNLKAYVRGGRWSALTIVVSSKWSQLGVQEVTSHGAGF